MRSFNLVALSGRSLLAMFFVASAAALVACSSGSPKPQPSELQALTSSGVAKLAWRTNTGSVDFGLQVNVNGDTVVLAGGAGSVLALDARSGKQLWQFEVGEALSAGVGADASMAAVVTQSGELVAMSKGRQLWREKLTAQVFTAPLVAGERVFLLSADRSVSAFDGKTGRKLWTQQRPGEPLVLRQPGVILPVGNTLVVGLSGRLAGLNPLDGNMIWEAPIASPRGINDVERLVDLVGRASRVGNSVCVRAFQARVGCVDAARGNLEWSKSAAGIAGLSGDDQIVTGTESDGKVLAWRRLDGELLWSFDRLRYRDVTAPLLVGRSLAVGDYQGFVHFLSRKDGALLNRLPTDGSSVVAAPVLAGGHVVVVTSAGGVYGFAPE